MFFTYDPILVIISIVVSIVGAYTCFDLVIRIRKHDEAVNKILLIQAALAIGGSIWAMHFVAMLAVNLPIVIRYDLLTTLISGLVSVIMTAVALLVVSTAPYSAKRVAVAGIVMGLGISSMHYVGMSAIRGNCGLSYSYAWVSLSVVIGMAASTASLWCAMRLHGVWRRTVAALIMGISISGVHYTSMAGTTFLPIDRALEFSQPILSPFSLGLVTAIATFVILGWTLLTLVPESRFTGLEGERSEPRDTIADDADASSPPEYLVDAEHIEPEIHLDKLPVQKNQKTYFVDFSDVASVAADGHYTSVFTAQGESLFCNYSLSRVEEELDPQVFLRVHRSHIVNLHQVESFERQHDKGLIYLRGSEHQIPVSRSYIGKLQDALGI